MQVQLRNSLLAVSVVHVIVPVAAGSVDGLTEASRQSRVCGGVANEIMCAVFRVLMEVCSLCCWPAPRQNSRCSAGLHDRARTGMHCRLHAFPDQGEGQGEGMILLCTGVWHWAVCQEALDLLRHHDGRAGAEHHA